MPATCSRRELHEVVALLREVTERDLGLLALRRDPRHDRIPPARRDDLVDAALRCGAEAADTVAAPFHAPDVLRRHGITLVEEPTADVPGLVVLATYTATRRGGVVRLSTTVLDRLGDVEDVLGLPRPAIRDAVVAHEVFHHVETHTPGIVTQRAHVTTGPRLRRRRPVRALSEIAAHAFARRVVGVPYSPRVLEVVAACVTDADLGRALVAEVADLRRPVGPRPPAP